MYEPKPACRCPRPRHANRDDPQHPDETGRCNRTGRLMSDDVVLLLYPNYNARAGGNRELSICKNCYYRRHFKRAHSASHPAISTQILLFRHTQIRHISKSGLTEMDFRNFTETQTTTFQIYLKFLCNWLKQYTSRGCF